MIEMGKQYQTRDGRPVRILAIDTGSSVGALVPVVGRIKEENGSETLFQWYSDGRASAMKDYPSPTDLIPVSTKHEGWVVIGWQDEDGCYLTNKVIWNTYGDAVEHAKHLSGIGQHIACVTWES